MSLIEMKEKLLKEFDEVVKEGHHNGEGISSQWEFWKVQRWPRTVVGEHTTEEPWNFQGRVLRVRPSRSLEARLLWTEKWEWKWCCVPVGKERLNGWLIDSGATSHITPHRLDLFDYEILNTDVEVTIVDGRKLRVHSKGTMKLTALNNRRIKMIDVLYIPGLDRRCLSVGNL